MKNKLIYTLILITILSLTACNSTELVNDTTQSTTESTVETATIPESTVASAESTTDTQTEEIYLQEDGIYYVSDTLRQKFRELSLFSHWADEEFEEELQRYLEKFYPLEPDAEKLLSQAEQISKDLEATNNVGKQQSVDVSNLMILVTEDGKIACSQELADSVKGSIKKAGLSDVLSGQVLSNYAEITKGMDNSVIHQDVIDNIINSFKTTIEVQNKAQQQQREEAQQQQQEQQNQNNNQGNSGNSNSGNSGNNNSNGNSSSAGADWQTPENDNPTSAEPWVEAGITKERYEEIVKQLQENDANAGDGGELITDGKLNSN